MDALSPLATSRRTKFEFEFEFEFESESEFEFKRKKGDGSNCPKGKREKSKVVSTENPLVCLPLPKEIGVP
jgi:hypothetical protein